MPGLSVRCRVAIFGTLAIGAGVVLTLGVASTSDPHANARVAAPVATAVPGVNSPELALRTKRVLDPAHPTTRAPGYYGAPVGTRLTFGLTAKTETELLRKDDNTRTDGGTIEITGRLQLTILERSDAHLVAAICFPGVQLDSPTKTGDAGRRLQALARALEQPVRLRLDPSGRALGYRFPAEFDFLAKSQVRAVLGNLRFVVPVDAASRWTSRDVDDTGEFEAVYAMRRQGPNADASLVSRRKLRYLSVTSSGGGGKCSVSVESDSTARLSKTVGWLVAARVEERKLLTMASIPVQVSARFRGELALERTEVVGLSDQPAVDGPFESPAGDESEALQVSQSAELDKWRKELEGVPLSGLVDWFTGLVANGADGDAAYRQAWERISWMCRLDPEAVSQLAEWIRSGRFDEKTASGLLTAMGNAGTPGAQSELTRIHAEKSLALPMRAAATVALIQAEKPSPKSIEALLATMKGPGIDEDLGKMSLLVFGALAGKSNMKLADGRTALATLIGMEQRAVEHGVIDGWLHALGNSGTPVVVEHAARYVRATDPRVREAAVDALRAIPSAAACDLLTACAKSDRTVDVRRRAVESLGAHRTERARMALRYVAGHDESKELRQLARELLKSV